MRLRTPLEVTHVVERRWGQAPSSKEPAPLLRHLNSQLLVSSKTSIRAGLKTVYLNQATLSARIVFEGGRNVLL